MVLYPNLYLKDVTKITIELVRANNIKALILDMDNTLLDFDKNIIEGGKEWINSMHEEGIKTCIVSNSAHKEKVEMLCEKIGINNYIYFAMKPLKGGTKKAVKLLRRTSY